MPKTLFNQQELDDFVKDRARHCFYKDSVEIARVMRVHADGLFPAKLLNERRPNESEQVFKYRKDIFEPKTKPTFSKIFTSLQKIRRSSDWSIKFDLDQFTKIKEGETLQDYTEYNYPSFTSVTNWVFTLMLRKYLIDPNAVVLVMPVEKQVEPNDYLKPIAQVFDSCNVIDFVDDDYAVLLNPEGCTYYSGKSPMKGKRYYFCTTTQILTYDQANGKNQYTLTEEYNHDLGVLPVFQLKGILVDQQDNRYLYESRISGIIPELNEAIREYSDLQAAKVMHIYPERWEFTQHECTNCKGTGLRNNPKYTAPDCGLPAQIECDKCMKGYTVAGPYSKILVKPQGVGEQQIPTPPAGYVEKDVEIVRIMDESVDKHVYKALSAINFQFLEKTPLAESGIAKEVDKDELNNMVHSIAEDIVAAMDMIYWLIALYRYSVQYSKEEIEEMIPEIPVPEKYDILSSSHLQDELKKAKDSKFNPVLLNAMESEYASKKFNTDAEVGDMVQLVLKLDPLPNITEDDKMSRLSNKGITQETYIVSSNIQEFIRRAIQDNKDFAEMELKKQKEIIAKYAQEVINEPEVKLLPDTGLDANGQPIINNAGQNMNEIPVTVPANA